MRTKCDSTAPKRQPKTTPSRRRLLTVLAACQLACLLTAVAWFAASLPGSYVQPIHDERQAFALRLLESLAAAEPADSGTLADGSPDMRRLCAWLAGLSTGGGLRVRLADQRGIPVCPDDGAALAGIAESGAAAPSPRGRAARPLGGTPYQLVAEWSDGDLRRTGRLLARRAWIAGLFLSVAAVLLGLAAFAGLLGRFERRAALGQRRLAQLVERRTLALHRTREAIVFGLARLAESRDLDTGEHLDRIRAYTELLARTLAGEFPELTPQTIQRLGVASSLHDIGKVGVPDNVLLKPGRLTPQERRIIQRHTLVGGDCLFAIKRRLAEDDFLELACEIAYGHHERWDGAGYPYGLQGEEIPLSARIVGMADVYDALTSPRVYKPAYSHETARQIILSESGRQFDPRVVRAFLRCEDEFRRISCSQSAASIEPAARQPTLVAV